ncbi:hypothetical protein J0X14_14395 [Muricauda sp. CAU 1633]|uniref:hypothetical protein n=1 Tax=Allomuricauda sp. CAU 1633 TaxID=2816036 RepID=UPI001A8C174E|nr:hypothetical protein [Muricauda sp. CAU 1633]MBO0323495.1 hypothetical protein [Muricauda sp. CAU 1633]
MEASLKQAKQMFSHYEEEIKKCSRKKELLEIQEEFEEAKKVDRVIEHYMVQQDHHANYLKAMEYYMEHKLQEA